MPHALELKRAVVVDDVEYLIEVRRSAPRHIDRFATRCYAIVERPDYWRATVPVPDCVRDTTQLWYRELIELVHHACNLVNRRAIQAA